jgi:hypothetical protein
LVRAVGMASLSSWPAGSWMPSPTMPSCTL